MRDDQAAHAPGYANSSAVPADLALIFNQAAAGIAQTDLAGAFIAVNDRYCQMLGRSRDELLTLRMQDITHPDDRSGNVDSFQNLAAGGPSFEIEKRYFRGDGAVIWVHNSVTGLAAADGVISSLIAVSIDVTTRIEAEQRLREREARQTFALRLSDALRPLEDAAEMQEVVCRLLGEQMGAAQVGFAEVDADGVGLTVRREWNSGRIASIIGAWRMEDFGPSLIRDLKAGETIAIPDVRLDERTNSLSVVAAYDAIAARAILDVPLVRGRMLALLFIHDFEPRSWTEDEIGLAEEVCSRLWSAVERAQAQAALRVERELLDTVVRQAPVGISISEAPSGRALTLNDKAVALLGHAQRGDDARRYEEYGAIHADGRPYDVDDYPTMRAIRQGEVVEQEEMLYRRGGIDGPQVTRLAVSSAPVHDDGHGVVAAVTVFIDIEEQRRAEERLRESEARYRTLFENIEVGFCIIEMRFDAEMKPIDYRLAELNPAFERQTGLHDAAGKWVSEVAPGIEPHWFETYGRVARTGEAVRFENYTEAFERWYDVYAFPTGEPHEHRVAVLFNDITGRKVAEDRLRDLNADLEVRVAERTAERNLLATLIETTDVMVMAIDHDFTILAINPANAGEFERIYGVRPRPGENMLALLADQPQHRDQVRATWSRGLCGETITIVEQFGSKARDRPYYQINFRPLFDDAGERIGCYQFVTDVSERLRKEAELDAAQEALRQSQKMEAMGQLTGGVAHDFNNLLTPIVGSLDMLLRKGIGNEREQRLIAGAAQSAERARLLVQRLLAFARRQPLQSVSVDVARLVSGMADLVASTTGPQIRVVVDAPDDLPPAMADPNQLEMALLNLAVNARDAMPDGGTLRISASDTDSGRPASLPPGAYIRLSVADTGQGMDEDTLARAIEPFFSTKGIGKGTGLGLSMVHGLASQLRGALTIHSRLGLGTNVELWLPQSALIATAERKEPVVPASTSEVLGTALLVDDEELVRLSTHDMLADLGYRVVEAASAEEAMRLVDRGERFDVLVTDHLMPGMNGTDLARTVRNVRPELPVLLVSGYAETDGIAADLPRLTKPFRKDELAASLAQLSSAR